MKIRVGIIDSLIETDNPKIIKVLSDNWAFPVQGYQYTPAYQRRGWDGKKRFITNTGRFKTGLLQDILNDLKKINCEPEIIREFEVRGGHVFETQINEFTLHDYQEKAVYNALRQEIGRAHV